MITLKTLPQATAQEVFDQVATHLLTQMIPSKNDSEGKCVYHNPEGLKCAAGCLIGDDEYNPEFDAPKGTSANTGWNALVNMGYVPPTHRNLIRALQEIHDCYQPYDWKEKLRQETEYLGLRWNHG